MDSQLSNILFISQLEISACLLVSGSFVITTLYLSPYLANKVLKAMLQECDPSSQKMDIQVLNLVKMFFFKNLITVWASLVGNA